MAHLRWHAEEYGATGVGALTMRKHLLWYLKGWPSGKQLKDELADTNDLTAVELQLEAFYQRLKAANVQHRVKSEAQDPTQRFIWDPKFEMDRKLDRGIGDDHL